MMMDDPSVADIALLERLRDRDGRRWLTCTTGTGGRRFRLPTEC
ncbi:MAG: hypothetical protein U0531_03680 [Dehalococcoidia bacterium]